MVDSPLLSLVIKEPKWLNVFVIPLGTQLEKGRHGIYHDIVRAARTIKHRFVCYAWGTKETIRYCGSVAGSRIRPGEPGLAAYFNYPRHDHEGSAAAQTQGRADAEIASGVRSGIFSFWLHARAWRAVVCYYSSLKCSFLRATGREIASVTGRSPSAVTHVWRELQDRLTVDMTFEQQVEALARILGAETP